MADEQLTFGRFSGSHVSQVPSYYLWYLIQNAYSAQIRRSAEEEWTHRTHTNRHWMMPKKKRFS